MISVLFAPKTAIICTLILYLKYVVTCLIHAKKREAAGLRAPEDTPDQKQNFGLVVDNLEEQTKAALVEEKRWARIVGNDLENIPFGLIIVWASILCGGKSGINGICIIVFTVARLAHTIFFVWAWSKARSVAYLVGAIAIIVMICAGIAGVFKDTGLEDINIV
ncbi:unnamed protein product [Aphanomyces euteiches]|uniref:Microsomal glutathione S-transferase 1 n=1 Tax=Aphanomyces euteiches TaxID=100861 RepID=A0A6G0XIY2_9STRA|nr:hypothetical protein Ae201684_004314 [Aphanomyces euteiches]KAH9094140.1 hypothetical protein Ae201684P_016752 [Aphanomyces euteiches]KAH9111289.1 hypothetical protein AeMF1_014143 [Aphanomyces euteiches]KAH9123928.1 hypothetical protein LEN26_009807 [Aphanomyces euteiches]KAH9131910.1 hypothetical protein AeRB84_021526 [Aphanomyces euteiches]